MSKINIVRFSSLALGFYLSAYCHFSANALPFWSEWILFLLITSLLALPQISVILENEKKRQDIL